MAKRPFLGFCLLFFGLLFGLPKPALAHFCELTLSKSGDLRAQELQALPHHLTTFLQSKSLIHPGDPSLLTDSVYYPSDSNEPSRVATRISNLEGPGPDRFVFDLTGSSDSFLQFFGNLRTAYTNENTGAVLRMTYPFVGFLLTAALFGSSLSFGPEYAAASAAVLAASGMHVLSKHLKLERMRRHIMHLTSVSSPLEKEFPEWRLLGMSDQIAKSEIPQDPPSAYMFPSVVTALQHLARTNKSVGVHWDILFFRNPNAPNAKDDGDLAQAFLTYLFVRIEP